MTELLEPFSRLLASDPDWDAIEASGFLDALTPDMGLSLAEVEPLLCATGYHGVCEPVIETMLLRGAGGQTLPLSLAAIGAACEIAGAAERILEMTVSYANDRVQFGKPIAKQQVVQHNLAIMGEQYLMIRMASQLGCSAGLAPPDHIVATAKQVSSAAVPVMVGLAHAIHGAIGITMDYDLHRYTTRMQQLRIAHGSESYWATKIGAAHLASGHDAVQSRMILGQV
jgi:acyl-CoA dehydrogenase